MEKTKKGEQEKQLDFGLKNPPQNIYFKYKDQYELWLSKLETHRFMRDVLTWFVLIMTSFLIFTQVYTIQELGHLPTKIPIFNYYFTLSMRLVDSNWIYMYPITGIFLLSLGMFCANKFYHKEKELSKTLLVVVFLANVSLTIIFMNLVNTF